MSYEDELKDFMMEEGFKPEEAFSMVTLMPKRKIKVSAYLEDQEGERVLLGDIAEDLVRYIKEHMTADESSPINSQFFPLINQFMISIVPRVVGLQVTEFMFTASALRSAMSMFGLSVALLMQYIQQHNLKIVTEEEAITEEELEDFMERGQKAESALAKALGVNFDEEDI
jgi:hypothetical protein